MKIGIDFDKCYRADPKTWAKVVEIFHENGHECVIVTKRRKHFLDRIKEVKDTVQGQIPIVFAGDEYKDPVAKKYGHDIDIWVDDHPEFIRSPSNIKDQLDQVKYQKFLLERQIDLLKGYIKAIINFLEEKLR